MNEWSQKPTRMSKATKSHLSYYPIIDSYLLLHTLLAVSRINLIQTPTPSQATISQNLFLELLEGNATTTTNFLYIEQLSILK